MWLLKYWNRLVETNVTNSGGSFCNWPSQSALVPLNPPKPERDVVHAFLLRPPSRVKGAGKVYKPQRASGWSSSSTDPRYVKIYDTLNLITFRTLQRIREFVSIKKLLTNWRFQWEIDYETYLSYCRQPPSWSRGWERPSAVYHSENSSTLDLALALFKPRGVFRPQDPGSFIYHNL